MSIGALACCVLGPDAVCAAGFGVWFRPRFPPLHAAVLRPQALSMRTVLVERNTTATAVFTSAFGTASQPTATLPSLGNLLAVLDCWSGHDGSRDAGWSFL